MNELTQLTSIMAIRYGIGQSNTRKAMRKTSKMKVCTERVRCSWRFSARSIVSFIKLAKLSLSSRFGFSIILILALLVVVIITIKDMVLGIIQPRLITAFLSKVYRLLIADNSCQKVSK